MGIRHRDVHDQGIATTWMRPSSPRCSTDPLKWKLSGT